MIATRRDGRRRFVVPEVWSDRRFPEDLAEAFAVLPDAPAPGAGRGETRVVSLWGRRARVKQLRRGGALARLWRERFVGTARLVANVTVPLAARARGLATPAPLGLMTLAGPPGLFRGWLATEEVEAAIDLHAAVLSERPPARDEWSLVLGTVRTMHDAGIDHVDLNLGNLLLRRPGPEVVVIDLDGARLYDGPVGFRARRRALRRLERSYRKVAGARLEPSVPAAFYELYASGNPRLAARLMTGR